VDNDRAPYVWRTTDYGATWTKIVSGIPGDDFVRAVREDPTRPGLLYAASERTVYVSWDDGANWQPLTRNLPTVQVSDIVVRDNDLVIATHGRSFWTMNNIGPLRQLTPQVAQAEVHLFDPADPVRGVDRGVEVFYNLKSAVDTVKLEFLTAQGEIIQTFTGTGEDRRQQAAPAEEFGPFGGGGAPRPRVTAGSHSFLWNLRYPGYTDFEGRIFWAAGNAGPTVVPGRYQVRLSAGGTTQTQDFEVKLDPRVRGVTIAQLRQRVDFALQIRDRVSVANEAVIKIRKAKSEIDDRLKKTDDRAIQQQAQLVKDRISAVEQEIYQVRNESSQDPLNFPIKLNNKLAALMGIVESADAPPSDQSRQVYEHLSGLLQQQLDRLDQALAQDLERLNALLTARNLEPIRIEAPVAATSGGGD
jgi:hypothetical protein